VQIVGIYHVPDPSEVLGASSKRAVRTSPLRLAIEASEAFAVVVFLASPVSIAVIL
jgi:hypothetical protein